MGALLEFAMEVSSSLWRKSFRAVVSEGWPGEPRSPGRPCISGDSRGRCSIGPQGPGSAEGSFAFSAPSSVSLSSGLFSFSDP